MAPMEPRPPYGMVACVTAHSLPLLTGRALRADHPLEPWSRATLVAGMPRGMVHRDQVGCRHGRVVYGHGEHASPLLTAEASGHLSGTRRCRVRWHTQHG
jgi:hypothetical protein